ncbi:MAG: hypothetical protein NC085_14495 [Muribaculaceae bacterium]|nr:hypothetical protein [Muribaculaceae bacterium]
MKKIIVLLAAALMLTACSNETAVNDVPQETTAVVTNVENPDFRTIKWGMSKESVIANEGTPSSENEFGETGDNFYRLVYDNVSVSNYSAELQYFFEDNSLYNATYTFDCNEKTDLQINTMYVVLRDKYIEKYGTPENTSVLLGNLDYYGVSEPPYVSDPNFSFDEMAMYKDEWSNKNGASISMSMDYFAIEGSDKSVYFKIVYNAISSDI